MKVIVHHGGSYWCPSWDTVYEFSDCLSYKFPKTYFTETEWGELHKKWEEEREKEEKEEKLEELKRKQQERNCYLQICRAILIVLSIFLLTSIII